jgi:hypothetical protein
MIYRTLLTTIVVLSQVDARLINARCENVQNIWNNLEQCNGGAPLKMSLQPDLELKFLGCVDLTKDDPTAPCPIHFAGVGTKKKLFDSCGNLIPGCTFIINETKPAKHKMSSLASSLNQACAGVSLPGLYKLNAETGGKCLRALTIASGDVICHSWGSAICSDNLSFMGNSITTFVGGLCPSSEETDYVTTKVRCIQTQGDPVPCAMFLCRHNLPILGDLIVEAIHHRADRAAGNGTISESLQVLYSFKEPDDLANVISKHLNAGGPMSEALLSEIANTVLTEVTEEVPHFLACGLNVPAHSMALYIRCVQAEGPSSIQRVLGNVQGTKESLFEVCDAIFEGCDLETNEALYNIEGIAVQYHAWYHIYTRTKALVLSNFYSYFAQSK